MPEQQGVDLDELLSDEHAGGDDLDAVDEQPIARLPGGPVWRVALTGAGGLLAQLTTAWSSSHWITNSSSKNRCPEWVSCRSTPTGSACPLSIGARAGSWPL